MTKYEEAMEALEGVKKDVVAAYAGKNKSATVRVRKAFQVAKDALHEAKKEVQEIKAGDANPVDIAVKEVEVCD